MHREGLLRLCNTVATSAICRHNYIIISQAPLIVPLFTFEWIPMTIPPTEGYQRFNPKLAWAGKILDFLHPALAMFINRWDEDPQSSSGLTHPRKILLLESHLIGDTVLTSSLLIALRSRFPEAKIHLLGNPWAKDILGALGIVDRFLIQRIPWATYDYSWKNLKQLWRLVQTLRLEDYDLAIEPRGDVRNAVLLWSARARRRLGFGCTGGHRFLTDLVPSPHPEAHLLDAKFGVLAPLGILGPPPTPWLVCDQKVEGKIRLYMDGLRVVHSGPWVGFHPGASQIQRRLSFSKQVSLLQELVSLGYYIMLLGTPNERSELLKIVHQSGVEAQVFTEGLPEAIAVLAQLDAFVGMDSGPAHIASALGTPVVVIVESQKAGITTPRGAAPSEWVAPRDGTLVEDISIIEVLEKLKFILKAGKRSIGAQTSQFNLDAIHVRHF